LNGLAVIERNARAQAQIIEDLLDMSSIISGKARLDVQRLELGPVINATLETIRPSAQAKGIRLQAMLDPTAGPIRGDPNRLQQVFWNLLTNAVKFTHQNGRVAVTLARVNSRLEVEVTDDGEGIDPNFLPHVFDRFRQADASTSRQHGGLGLGLSIVKQLIEMHGGSISAESAGKGLGSTFRITLPVVATSEQSEQPQVSRQHPVRFAEPTAPESGLRTDLGGMKVLVVDDEPDARALVERLLVDCNARVTTASSTDDAMKALMQENFDVLISDVGMPGEDGYGLVRRVRALPDGHSTVPAIALTAYARIEDRARAIHAGFQLHLSKPIEPIELIAMVQSVARRSVAKQ
jgi:CheY-like chemotaxis protein/two-component sensor histidine kinase